MSLARRSVVSESSWLLPLRPPNRVLAPCLTGVGSSPAGTTPGLCGSCLADGGSPKGGRASDSAVPRAQLGLWLLDSAWQSSSWRKRMRNSGVELKTSLRSFWWAGVEGSYLPSFLLPHPLQLQPGYPVPFSLPWG